MNSAESPRPGQWLNIFLAGRIVLQGHVIDRSGELCLIDLFHPGDQRPFDRAWFDCSAHRLQVYDTRAEMQAAQTGSPHRSNEVRARDAE